MDPRMTDLVDLAHLDPTRDRQLSDEEMVRGRAQLDRVIASPTTTEKPQRARRRVAMAGALAGGLALTALFAGNVVGGGPKPAYADWTPKPSAISAEQARQLADECAKQWPDAFSHHAFKVVLAERRGQGTIVLIQRGRDIGLLCTSVSSTGTAAQGFDNSSGPSRPSLGADHVGVAFKSSGPLGSDRVQAYSYLAGPVGDDVTGVDALTVAEGSVEATISNGWYAAWWPCNKDNDEVTNLVVHLKDGTSLTQKA